VRHFFNPKPRHWWAGLLVAAGIVLVPQHGVAQQAAAAKGSYAVVGYNRTIKQEDFAGLSKDTVRHMQAQLEVIYRDLPDWKRDFALKEQPLNDGIVGPITLHWLQRYGYNFKIDTEGDFAQGLPANMDRIAAFGAANPAELDILLSREFEDWDAAQRAGVRSQDYQVRRVGDTSALLELVNRFRASRKAAPRTAAAAVDAGGYYTYVLEQADLDLLAGKDQVMTMLAKLKDKKFNSLDEMKIALLQALNGREEQLKSLWPVVKNNTPEFDGFLINKAALERLKKEGTVRADTLEELGDLGTVYLTSREAYDKLINDKVTAGNLAINAQETEILAEGTRVFDNFHLNEQSLDTIKKELKSAVQNAGVPAVVATLMEQIKEVDYAEASLFRSAVTSKIGMGLGMCRLNSPRNNAYVAGLRISDDQLASLKKELEVLKPQAGDGLKLLGAGLDETFSQIAVLRARNELCDEATKLKGEDYVRGIYLAYLAMPVESAARKKIPDEIAPIKIKGSDCGCALDDLSGVVYGFYPYWKKQKGPQAINFRVLNRMAYYGVTIDNGGDFRLGANSFNAQDGSPGENEFVRVAHQYNSKVDWMVQKNDWDGEWKTSSVTTKETFFKKLEANIVTLLSTHRTDTASALRPYTSFGLAGPTRRGDGVTLYFPDYPDDSDARALFNNFYLSLRVEMDKRGMWLNVLVSQDTLMDDKNSGGTFSLGNLASLRKKRNATEPLKGTGMPDNDEYVLVLMNEPSSDAKKKLRSDIENESGLYGADRADFLRSILPVWHFDDRNFQQLEDDVVYSRDNFGGVGFWAPDFDNLAKPVADPGESCLQSKSMTICLLKNYRDDSVSASMPGPVERFVCVNRWFFQIALTLLALLIVALVVLYFRVCRAQNFIKKYFLLLLGLVGLPTLVLFTLLMGYDPYFAKLSRGQLPFIAASTFLLLVLAAGGIYLRTRRQLPLRERGLPQRQGLGFPIVRWEVKHGKEGFQWIITNGGSGYAIIKKVEILIDQHRVADVKTALGEIWDSDSSLPWKSVPLVGQKLRPGESLAALTIVDPKAVADFEHKLSTHKLEVHISYTGASNEHWVSNGREIMLASET
jgi:hypothetical protein